MGAKDIRMELANPTQWVEGMATGPNWPDLESGDNLVGRTDIDLNNET